MIKNYEGVFIFSPSIKEEDIEKRLQEIAASIASQKGEVLKKETLGRRRLAYPILKNQEGVYHILNFKASSEAVNSVKSECRHIPDLIRFMIVKIE